MGLNVSKLQGYVAIIDQLSSSRSSPLDLSMRARHMACYDKWTTRPSDLIVSSLPMFLSPHSEQIGHMCRNLSLSSLMKVNPMATASLAFFSPLIKSQHDTWYTNITCDNQFDENQ